MMGERIQTPLYAGHHWLTSETPFKWRFADVLLARHRVLALGSFVILKGNRTSMLRNPIFDDFSGGGGGGGGLSPLWIRPLAVFF